jgi:2-amino-4-hydroxy-6-hydroxymethyldihydropteridine diphosphokinase
MRNRLDLEQCALWQRSYRYRRTRRAIVAEEFYVDVVHRAVDAHVRDEKRGLHDVCQAGALTFQEGNEIADGTARLRIEAVDEVSSLVDSDLSGYVEKVSSADNGRVRTNGSSHAQMLPLRVVKTVVMHRVFLGLGSNLGDRLHHLRQAVTALPDVVNISPLYETEPMGGPDDQPEYLNCVVELHTPMSAREVLTVAQRLEIEAGRVRTVVNGPRTLDVDILLFDDTRIEEPDLVVPHPRMWERRFVVRPLVDIAPDVVPIELHASGTGGIRRLMQYWASSTN